MLLGCRGDKINVKTNKVLIRQAVMLASFVTPMSLCAEEVLDEESAIEVVTVTAQKRVQNILKVPVTVGSVSEETIEESGSILLSEIDKFIPGFEFSDKSMTQAGITMRGISSPNISVGGDPSSATFYDDVYMPRAAQNVVFSDMERVEVLKGPQGTLFGRNAAMGVVNMLPKSPSSEFEGFVKATLGSDNLQRYEGMINIPLTDNVYIRANALSNTQDGIAENISAPAWNEGTKVWDLDERGHDAARVSVLWNISEQTAVQFSYDWDDLEQSPQMAVGVGEYAYNNGQSPFATTIENDVRMGVEKRDMSGSTAKLNHEFNNEWSMKYILSYREWDTVNRSDEDGTSDITRYFDTSNNEDSDILYTELQVNYISEKINAVAGFSYSKEKVNQTTELTMTADTSARLVTEQLNQLIWQSVADEITGMIGGSTDDHAAGAFGDGATFSGVVDSYFAASGFPMEYLWNADEWANTLNTLGYADAIMEGISMPGLPLTADVVNLTGDITYDVVSAQLGVAEIFGPSYSGSFWQETVNNTGSFTNWGIFADVDYSINEQWNVIGGVRYSQDKKDFTWSIPLTSFAALRPGVGNLIYQQANMAASDDWNKVTGRLVTSYQLTDNHMLFASYSTGYKSGGFDSLRPSHQSFEPEDTSNIEIGYKGIAWGQLIANISVYYLSLDNFQTTKDSKPPGSLQATPIIFNEDKAITGVELDFRWNATDSLLLGLVSEIRSTDTKTPDFYNGEGALITATTTSIDSSINYTLTLDWMPDFSVGTTNLHVDYVFQENINEEQAGLEDYVKAVSAYFKDTKDLNARLSWVNDADNFEIGVWGKNLLDERYVYSVGGFTADILNTPLARVNRGLEAGIDIKYSF